MKSKPTIEMIGYIVATGWSFLLIKYLFTDHLDKQLFITVSGALGTIAGLIGANRVNSNKDSDSDDKNDKGKGDSDKSDKEEDKEDKGESS